MVAIPFPVSSSPGLKPQEGAGRLINCFARKTETGARAPVVWVRTAGLRELVDVVSHVHLRGAIDVSGVVVAAFNSRVWTIVESSGTFTATNRGALAGTDRITVARNAAATPNIVAVTSSGAFNLFTSSAPTAFADPDLPQPNSVCNVKNYLTFTIGDGRIFTTGLNAVTVASNAFTTYQTRPGGLLRGVNFQGELIVFGPGGGAVYRDAGASPFPFEFVTDIPRGIAGTHAIAGWEEGWSNQLIWAGDDGVVYKLQGYTPVPISSDDVSRDVAKAIADGEGATLEASVFMQGKDAMWRLTNPGVWTWEYNASTQNWHERTSYNRDDGRACWGMRAFDTWICGDRTTGKIFEIDETYHREATDPLRYILRSGPAAVFPSRLQIPRIDLDITAAVGDAAGSDPTETNPSVLIRWSKDGGYSFGNPVRRRIGPEGVGNNRVTVLRGPITGPKGIVVEMEVSDPVHVGCMGGEMAGVQRAV